MFINKHPTCDFKAVLFDMGGVLLRYKDPTAYNRLIDACRANKETAKGLYNFDHGVQAVEELRDILRDLLPGLPEQGNIETAEVENYSILSQDLIKITSKLHKHGIKVAIVTNNGYWTRKKKRTVILTDTSPFDLVLESCKVGLRKPDPAIYKLAAERLGVLPSQCIFMDDSEINCRGAASVGMTPIFIAAGEPERQAIVSLERLLNIPLTNTLVVVTQAAEVDMFKKFSLY